MMKKLFLTSVMTLSLLAGGSVIAQAADGGAELPEQDWHFSGPFGQYDKGALQRGFLVYKQVCSACHSMQRLSYRNLDGLGYDESQIKAIASEFTITDGPNDEGDYYERPGRPTDAFKSPFENIQQAKAANNGAAPPDLSLMAFARHGGADYIYALLAEGYGHVPDNVHLMDGQYYNTYMAGHIIAMAPPLSDGLVAYEDGSPETIEQYAKDISEFLTYAADPKMETRKDFGIRAMIFLFFFTLIFFLAKKKIWKDVKH